jgi:hypothetical protein
MRAWARILVVFLLAFAARVSAQTPPLTGTMTDETGGVLQNATVELTAADGRTVATAHTDSHGTFQFAGLAPGAYQLRASFDGFKTVTVRVRLAGRPVTQRLVLPLASITDSVAVDTGGTDLSASNATNPDAVAIDQDLLAALPVFDRDVIATASQFLDASAIGTGGVIVVVNGMEVSSLTLPASAVQQIKVNQDPYSAEFSRPGRGRIEILTKPASQTFTGETNLTLRDGRLNARNAFSTAPPRDRRHIFDGTVSGPLGHNHKAAFLIAAQDDTDDQRAVVFAATPTGIVHDVSPQPTSHALLTGTLTFVPGPRTTISIRPAYQYESSLQRGVGGVTLATAGANFRHHEQSVTYTHQTVIRPTLVNQFQILAGHEREPTTSTTDAPAIIVAGGFTGGGAQADLGRTERHIQLTESLAWTHGHHLTQAGFQLPDWSRRGFEDRTNRGGTFYFADLDAYVAGTPDVFIQQRGNGNVAFLEKQVGAYVRDDWQIRPSISLSAGIRYDWQNYFHDTDNVGPRLSLAYAPGKASRNVFRVGAGVFTDRSGPVVIADLLHARPGGLTRYVITRPSYPDVSDADLAAQPRSIAQLSPDVRIPQTLQFSAGWDHQISKTVTITTASTGTRSNSLFRSRDVNAPLPPQYSTRPDPAFGAIRDIEATGRQRGHSLQVSLRGRAAKWFTGQAQYTWSRLKNDTSGINSFPANDYDLSGEWGRADSDRRHRVTALGRIRATRLFDIGANVTINSGAPYSETLGGDVLGNGRGRARPDGVGRNTLQGPPFADLDLRLSRDVKLPSARTLVVALDAFNVTNRVNYTNFMGTVGSPLFSQPIAAGPPRQIQGSVRVTF